ncbi:gnat family protein [Cystoisospora suis]|uniref:Gnat family protein n=1 Tax=Cystoisospora suis TaxID=483139 RepID=A0A2C6KU81_9APIC|nr:gnat family protein [Cystoisospora suis]
MQPAASGDHSSLVPPSLSIPPSLHDHGQADTASQHSSVRSEHFSSPPSAPSMSPSDSSPGAHTSVSSSDLPSSPENDLLRSESAPDGDGRAIAAEAAQRGVILGQEELLSSSSPRSCAPRSFPGSPRGASVLGFSGDIRPSPEGAVSSSRTERPRVSSTPGSHDALSTDSPAPKRTHEVSLSSEMSLPAAQTHRQGRGGGTDPLSAVSSRTRVESWETTEEKTYGIPLTRSPTSETGDGAAATDADSFLSRSTVFNAYSAYSAGSSADGGGEPTRRRKGTDEIAEAVASRGGGGVRDQDTLGVTEDRFGRGNGQDNITVRPYRSADAEAVRRLCHRHFRSLTLPSVFFWICHHSFDLLALLIISLFFAPLQRVMLGGLMFFGYLLLRGVWEFEMYIRHDCPDLNNIKESYMRTKASGFWVAERTEVDSERSGIVKKRIVGCIGLAPLQNDNKTAQLVRLVVDRSLRRQHIGTLLLNTFINYAVQQHYTIVRLYTNNLNNDSIRFAKTKGFELQQVVRRGLMRGDLLKWQKKLEAPGVTQKKTRVSSLPSSVLD